MNFRPVVKLFQYPQPPANLLKCLCRGYPAHQ